MSKVHIVTDSTSDISQALAEKLGIDVVPVHVNIDGVDYVDGLTISNQEFFKKLRTAKVLPKTAAPSPLAFLEVLKKYPKDEEVLIMTISADASATYSSAKIAVEECKRNNVHLLDTRQATLGLLALSTPPSHSAIKATMPLKLLNVFKKLVSGLLCKLPLTIYVTYAWVGVSRLL